jgi:hypothetical protein
MNARDIKPDLPSQMVDEASLVLRFAIAVTYGWHGQAAGCHCSLAASFARRAVRSCRVNVH